MTEPSPRSWTAPAEPDLTVSRVVGRDGREWRRFDGLVGQVWETVRGQRYVLDWSTLFWEHGPLTEVPLP